MAVSGPPMSRPGGLTLMSEPIAAATLADALGSWTTRPGPLYARLADAIADAIAQGHLGLGTRLPSERALAGHLQVARGTVVAAYDALRTRRIVQTRRGSGTVVHHRALLSRLVDGHEVAIDLALSAPMLEPEEMADITVSLREASRLVAPHGYAPVGLPALRAAIAARYGDRGIPTTADQIIVTAGGQGALSLIAATLLRPGDRVVTEAPTYPAAIEVFVRVGARVEGVPRDHAGPVIDRLAQVLARESPRMIYVIPTCHNPTGSVMSEARRMAVLRLARERGAVVVEDAVIEDLILEGAPPPSLAALDPDRVITVGSLSKTVWGGLRVGWIRASGETILRLGRVRAGLELGSPVLEQAAALEVLGRYDDLLARRRELISTRLGVLREALASHLPDWSVPAPRGGLSVWAELPWGSADILAQLALRRGVAISPGRTAAPGEEFPGHVRLSAGPPPALIREGVRRLAGAWAQLPDLDTSLDPHPVAV